MAPLRILCQFNTQYAEQLFRVVAPAPAYALRHHHLLYPRPQRSSAKPLVDPLNRCYPRQRLQLMQVTCHNTAKGDHMQTLFIAYLYFGLGYSTSCMIGVLLDDTEETHHSIWATLYDE